VPSRAQFATWLLALGGILWPYTSGSADKIEVHLSRIARITTDAPGNYQFFRIAVAPDAANRAIVCTLHWDPGTDEGTAELFASSDAGKTWSLRLTDASSRSVSEDACAFGEHGSAYFIAQPWNIRDPYATRALMDRSEMHFYRSSDYGQTWPAHLTSAFMDYARIAVDTRASSRFRGNAYIAGNRTADRSFPLVAVLNHGRQLLNARESDGLRDRPELDKGHYPRTVLILRNGEVLTSYFNGSGGRGKNEPVVTVSRDGGRTVDGPFSVDSDLCCGPGVPSLDENPRDGAVYAFYGVKENGKTKPVIACSRDGGKTWERVVTPVDRVIAPSKVSVILPGGIVFRKDGVVLLTWAADGIVRAALFHSNWSILWTGVISPRFTSGTNPFADASFPYVRPDFRADQQNGGSTDAALDVRLQFDSTRYTRVDSALTSDGGFLVVWSGTDGQLYSRSISLSATAETTHAALPCTADVTAAVRYEARDVRFDENSRTFEYDLALVNASDSSLVGPFFLKINRVSSSIGPVSVRGLSEDAIIFTARHELLPPGEYTAPSHVRIQVSGDIGERLTAALDHNPGIGLIGRVYAACSSKPE